MSKIHLGKGLTFDAHELATEVSVAIGMRGSGKSNVMAVVAEELLAAKVQVIVLDYVGIWFSLRLGPDGKHPSPFEIPVLGGKHGDVGLQATAGKLVAEALVQSGSPAVLDLSGFSKADRCRFAADFAERLFECKRESPGACWLVLEEAQRFVPQKIMTGMEYLARMLGAFEEIAEVGRNFGLGLGLITQRPQKVAKDVVNLADTVFGFRLNGVLERKAVAEWVQEKGVEGREDVSGELPGLPRGTALVWAPNRGLYGKYALNKKTTYDAGATPIHAREAVKMKALDLGELEASMANVVEQSKENDPKALKAEVARLKTELARVVKAAIVSAVPAKTVEVTVVPPEVEQAFVAVDGTFIKLCGALDVIGQEIKQCAAVVASARRQATKVRPRKLIRPVRVLGLSPPPRWEMNGASADIGKGERIILIAVAQHLDGITREHLTVQTGYKRSTRDAYVQRLATAGLVEVQGDKIVVTDAGTAELGDDYQPLPTGEALLAYHMTRLPEGERKVLEVVSGLYPGPVSRELVSELTGYKRSTRDAYLQRLSTRRLVVSAGGGEVKASENLF